MRATDEASMQEHEGMEETDEHPDLLAGFATVVSPIIWATSHAMAMWRLSFSSVPVQ